MEVGQKKKKLDNSKPQIVSLSNKNTDEEFNMFKKLHSNEEPLHKTFAEKPREEDIEKLMLEKKKNQIIKMFNLDEIQEITNENEELLKNNEIINKINKLKNY